MEDEESFIETEKIHGEIGVHGKEGRSLGLNVLRWRGQAGDHVGLSGK